MKELGGLRFLLQVRFIATNFCTYYDKKYKRQKYTWIAWKIDNTSVFFSQLYGGWHKLAPFHTNVCKFS